MATTARTQLFHNARAGEGKQVVQRPVAQNKASSEKATAVVSQLKAEILSLIR